MFNNLIHKEKFRHLTSANYGSSSILNEENIYVRIEVAVEEYNYVLLEVAVGFEYQIFVVENYQKKNNMDGRPWTYNFIMKTSN